MTKLTYEEMFKAIQEHNKEHNINSQYDDPNPMKCVIVFKNESWPDRKEDYSLESRSYAFRNDEKFFLPEMIGSSIFADSLDGSDECIRLDRYLGYWLIDYCYIA